MRTRLGRYFLPISAAFGLIVSATFAAELPEDIWSGRYGGFPSLTVGPNEAVSMEIPAEAIVQAGGGSAAGLAKAARLAAEHGVKAAFFLVEVTTERLETIGRLLEAGTLKTAVGAVLPLASARVAHEMLEGMRPRPRGKIVLQVAN